MNQSLNDMDRSAKYDQFENRNTDYEFSKYSTQINEDKITDDLKKRAEKVEQEILNKKSGNKHQAEERNQIDLKDEGDYEDEEHRYGAVDRRDKVVVYGSKATKGNVKPKRFKAYHESIDSEGLSKMRQGFLDEIGLVRQADFFAVPG